MYGIKEFVRNQIWNNPWERTPDNDSSRFKHPKNCFASGCAVALIAITAVAYFVVLPMGIHGKFPITAFRWTVISLSVATAAGWLLVGNVNKKPVSTCLFVSIFSTLVVLAVLQHANVLSYKQAAAGMLTTFLIGGFFAISIRTDGVFNPGIREENELLLFCSGSRTPV